MYRKADRLLEEDSNEHRRVQRVLDHLVPHADLPNETWEAHVIDDPDIQAYALPTGKVFVTTGMLNLCTREDELAIMLGHEMAHLTCHHSSERLSRWLVVSPLVVIGSLASGMNEGLVELGISVAFTLPHSRAHESEADRLGLLLAAKSGYDASAAVDLWSKWDAVEPVSIPQYLSTHPSHYNRLTQFHKWNRDDCKQRLLHDQKRKSCTKALG